MKKIIKQYLNINLDAFYLKCALSSFILWLFSTTPLRRIIRDTPFESSWFAGVLPNFFAGVTLVFWQTFGTGIKPLVSFFYTVLILSLSEFIQLFMRGHRADWNDILASIVGALLASAFVFFRSKRQRANSEK